MAVIRFAGCSKVLIAGSASFAGMMVIDRVNAGGKKVNPSELDIYDSPLTVQDIVLEDPASALELQVSTGRKAVWDYWDRAKGYVATGKKIFGTVRKNSIEFAELITTDQVFQIKVGCISAGVLGGALLAGRGRRPFRRFVYSAGLGTVAASLCYPSKAADVSLTGYKKAKVFVSEQWTKYKEKKATVPETMSEEKILESIPEEPADATEPFVVVDKSDIPPAEELVKEEEIEPPIGKAEEGELIKEDLKPEVAQSSEIKQDSVMSKVPFLGWFFQSKSSTVDEKQIESNLKKEESSSSEAENATVDKSAVFTDEVSEIETQEEKQSEKPVVVGGDHGQSNPEDKDMYSTRT